MSETAKAVFLSYASQDAEAARRICEALRTAGVEVWFDQSELVGGDAWDAKIREQISSCALFVPVISAETQARREGYFRIEWRLAAQRTHAMSDDTPFLLPVVIDDTRDAEARVPAEFKAVQWTRLRQAYGGQARDDARDDASVVPFCARVQRLLGGATVEAASTSERAQARWPTRKAADESRPEVPPTKTRRRPWLKPLIAGIVVLVAVLAVAVKMRFGATTASAANSPAALTLARVRTMLDKFDVTRAELDVSGELLSQAAKVDPANARVFASLAMVDCRYLSEFYDRSSDRRNAASRHMAQAVSLDAADPEVRIARATTMRAFNDDDATRTEVRTRLEALQREFPTDPRVLNELGWVTKDLPAAEECWDRQARIPGWTAAAGFNRAMRRLFSGNMSGSYAAMAETSSHARSTKVLLWKAYLEIIWLGDLARARQTMAEVAPDAFVEDMAASARYFVSFWSRDYQQALAAVQAVPRDYMESGASVSPTGFMRGVALQRLGRSAAADNEWRAALAATERRIEADRNNGSLLLGKAILLACLNDKPAAEQVWRTARELQGESSDWLNDYLGAMLLPPEAEIERLEKQAHSGADFMTAAILRLNPYYDHLRQIPRFIALQAEADANPALSPTAADRARPNDLTPKLAVGADQKSVAVLAFANLSDEKGNEYFSDGISEELLNVLAKVPGLKVSARTSAFFFKGKQVPISDIAQQLGVAYVIEGSVRKQGDRVRITAQLIKAADGFPVWSDTFTRDLKDIFAVQDEIAGLVARNLELKLGAGRPAARTVDPEAHRLVLEGRHYLALRGGANFARAEEAFRAAVAIAPDLAVAHAGWAELVAQRGRFQQLAGLAAPGSQLAEVQGHVERALQLDPHLSEPHAALSAALLDSGRLDEAEAAAARGLAANPNYGSLYLWQAHVHVARGRLDLALSSLQRATELDPLAFVGLYIRAAYVAHSGRHAEALELADRAASLRGEPFLPLEGERAVGRSLLGRHEEAMGLAREILTLPDLITLGWWSMGEALWVLRQGGAEAEAVRQGEALLAQLAPDNYLRGYVLCGLGRFEEGLPLLRQLPLLARSRIYYFPMFDPVRESAAFRTLIQEWNVAPEYSVARETLARLIQGSKK